MTRKQCSCAAHRTRRYRDTDAHTFRWVGERRWIAVDDGAGNLLTPWFDDGIGPIEVVCPDCGAISAIGPGVEYSHEVH